MKTSITPLAIAKLTYLLYQEQQEDERLAIRVIPLTSGCSTPSFALEITQPNPSWEQIEIEGILFAFPPKERAWLDGLFIDFNRETGKFSIYHPNPPFMSDCQLPPL